MPVVWIILGVKLLHKLLALSAGIEADGAFARQARRKFVVS